MTALEEYGAFMDAIGSGEWGITTGQIAGMADDAIAELKKQVEFKDKALDGMHAQLREAEAEVKLAWLAVEAEQSVTEKLEAEVEKLANRLNKMEESYVRTINRDGEYANGLLAEVERLTWMLDRCLHDFMETVEGEWGLHDDESYESWLADLARRWEERDD